MLIIHRHIHNFCFCLISGFPGKKSGSAEKSLKERQTLLPMLLGGKKKKNKRAA